MVEKFNRILGAMYGVAVGDALGGPLEFMSRDAVRKAYPDGLRDMVGGGWLNLKPGETTDDTAMTLCVASGITESNFYSRGRRISDDLLANCIGNQFIQWLESNPPDVGNTCREAINRAKRDLSKGIVPTQAWRQAAASLGPNQEGNGALMRCVYPGLFAYSPREAESMARFQALMTHSGKQSEDLCAWYANAIFHLVENSSEARDVLALSSIPVPISPVSSDWSPSGYVVETVQAVMLAMRESTFEGTLVKAVNFGGDADTVGAIAGGLAGAKYGFKAIPERWVNALDSSLRSHLDALAQIAYDNRE